MENNEIKTNHSKVFLALLAILLVANVILAVLLERSLSEKRCLEAQFRENTGVLENMVEEIDITLPETIYVANDITMEFYNIQVTSLGSDVTKYNVLWNCEIGENLERKFSVTADEEKVGSYELTLEIYNNDLELLAQKACTLKIVEGNMHQRKVAQAVTELSEIPTECLEQVQICVDTAYNGAMEELKPEGVAQMQDVIYSVLSGI